MPRAGLAALCVLYGTTQGVNDFSSYIDISYLINLINLYLHRLTTHPDDHKNRPDSTAYTHGSARLHMPSKSSATLAKRAADAQQLVASEMRTPQPGVGEKELQLSEDIVSMSSSVALNVLVLPTRT